MKHKTLGVVMRAASWVYFALWCFLLVSSAAGALFYKAPEGAGGLEAADGKIYGAFFLLSVFGIISAALLPLSVGMLCKSGGRRAVKRLSVAAAAADNVIYLVFFCLLILVDRDWVGWIIPVWIIDLLLCIVLLACSEVREK